MHKHWQSSVKGRLLFSLCVLTLISLIYLQTAQANDVTGDFSNNYEGSNVDSGNASETNNYNGTGAGSPAPVMSAIAPTMMGAGGSDSCLMPTTSGISLSVMGLSHGSMAQDAACNIRRNVRLLASPRELGGLNLQVSGISLLCAEPSGTVALAMMRASTPCPVLDVVTGKLLMGTDAIAKYRQSPEFFISGYKLHKEAWDALLRIGEDISDEILKSQASTAAISRSISDQFRSSSRNNFTTTSHNSGKLRPDGGTEDNGTQGDN